MINARWYKVRPDGDGGKVANFPANCYLGSPFETLLDDLDFTLIDVGMRGGAEPDLLPIAFATHVIGFEPEPAAFDALIAAGKGAWKSRHVFPTALAAGETTLRLYVTDDPQSSSVLEPEEKLGKAYGKQQFFDVDHTVEVAATTLDAALADGEFPAPGFLKLDVEGLEGRILEGAGDTLKEIAFIKIEVSTQRFNKGQPVFGELDRMLADRGFRLFDLLSLHRWRRNGHMVHPQLDRGPYPYARPPLIHGDALYVRDIFPDGAEADNHVLALRAVAGLLAYGYFDDALAVLQQDSLSRRLREKYGLDVDSAIALASRKFGRMAWRRAFHEHLRGVGTFVRSGIRGYRPW